MSTLKCFIATLTLPVLGVYGRLVHVGETLNRFWAVDCTKNAFGGRARPDPPGEL